MDTGYQTYDFQRKPQTFQQNGQDYQHAAGDGAAAGGENQPQNQDFDHQPQIHGNTNGLGGHDEYGGQAHTGSVFVDLSAQGNGKGIDFFRGSQAFCTGHVDGDGTGAGTGTEGGDHDPAGLPVEFLGTDTGEQKNQKSIQTAHGQDTQVDAADVFGQSPKNLAAVFAYGNSNQGKNPIGCQNHHNGYHFAHQVGHILEEGGQPFPGGFREKEEGNAGDGTDKDDLIKPALHHSFEYIAGNQGQQGGTDGGQFSDYAFVGPFQRQVHSGFDGQSNDHPHHHGNGTGGNVIEDDPAADPSEGFRAVQVGDAGNQVHDDQRHGNAFEAGKEKFTQRLEPGRARSHEPAGQDAQNHACYHFVDQRYALVFSHMMIPPCIKTVL